MDIYRCITCEGKLINDSRPFLIKHAGHRLKLPTSLSLWEKAVIVYWFLKNSVVKNAFFSSS